MYSSRMCTVRCSGRLSCHAHTPATHAPLPCMSPCHACIPCHTCPSFHHACPLCHVYPFAMHTLFAMQAPFTTHASPSPRQPPFTMHAPSLWTDACENITFPQLLLRMEIWISVIRDDAPFNMYSNSPNQ